MVNIIIFSEVQVRSPSTRSCHVARAVDSHCQSSSLRPRLLRHVRRGHRSHQSVRWTALSHFPFPRLRDSHRAYGQDRRHRWFRGRGVLGALRRRDGHGCQGQVPGQRAAFAAAGRRRVPVRELAVPRSNHKGWLRIFLLKKPCLHRTFLLAYLMALILAINLAKISGLFSAISAKTLRSNSILLFLSKSINLL